MYKKKSLNMNVNKMNIIIYKKLYMYKQSYIRM